MVNKEIDMVEFTINLMDQLEKQLVNFSQVNYIKKNSPKDQLVKNNPDAYFNNSSIGAYTAPTDQKEAVMNYIKRIKERKNGKNRS